VISVSRCGSALLLRVAGDVDATDAVTLRNAISEAVQTLTQCDVIIEVSGARLGWRGLALLVDEQTLLEGQGGNLCVVTEANAPDPGLARLFHLHASVEAALASLA
jgi:anti-anti-sigma factor